MSSVDDFFKPLFQTLPFGNREMFEAPFSQIRWVPCDRISTF
jgi:hypothetical protein